MFLHQSVCSQGGGGLPTEGGVCIQRRKSAYRGRGSAYKRGGGLLMGGAVCLQGEGSAAYRRGFGRTTPPPEPEKWAVCILLECFLVTFIFGDFGRTPVLFDIEKAVVSSPIFQTVSSEHQRILINRFMIITTLASFQIVTSKFPFSLTLSVNSYLANKRYSRKITSLSFRIRQFYVYCSLIDVFA